MTNTETTIPTLDALCRIVAGAIKTDGTPIDADTELLLTGLLDSLTVVKIVSELETAIGVELPQTMVVARNFRTPRALHDALTTVLEPGASR